MSPAPSRTLRLADPDATARLAAGLAKLARAGDAVLLEGALGAGKSAFARAFLRALTAKPALEVPSPTFTLVQAYDLLGGGQAWHFDLYRLAAAAEVAELGWDEAREDLVVVEWPDRLGAARPTGPEVLTITLALGDAPDAREATLSGWPGRAVAAAVDAVLRA